MLIDLFLVVVLGAALGWSAGLASWKRSFSGSWRSLLQFAAALLRSRLGGLLVLLAIAVTLQWFAQLAIGGWRSLDPATATGELEEGERCHAWQRRITGAVHGEEFAPSELVCPVGGGRYTQGANGHLSCGLHGEAP